MWLIRVYPLALLFLTLFTLTDAVAEEGEAGDSLVAAVMAAMPVEGRTVGDFVPPGWAIHTEATGDLNGDGRDDRVIDVTIEADGLYPPPDIVIVLFARTDGSFERIAASARLATGDFDGRPHELSIRKGVLVVHSNFGMGWAWDVVYRFRFDRESGRMMLIGYDHETYTRAGVDDAFAVSENYLTGVRIETTKVVDRRAKRKGIYRREEAKRSTIERYRVALESVDYDEEGANPSGRPFAH